MTEIAVVGPRLNKDDVHGSMDRAIVEKDKLLETLRTNREKHMADFGEALDAYYDTAVRLLQEHVERIRKRAVEKVAVYLDPPVNHVEDYDLAIELLEWTLTDTVNLTTQQFGQYVRDDWAWKQQFTTTNSTYTGR